MTRSSTAPASPVLEVTCAELAPELNVDAASLAAADRAAFAAFWAAHEDDWHLGKLDSAALTREVWCRALHACGIDSLEAIERAAQVHESHTNAALRLFEDVPRFLERVTGRCILGIVSNGARDWQRDKLEQLDLARHFEVVAISAELGVMKPDRAIFDHALARLGVTAREDVWHVGDSLRADVAGARSAGIGAVWLNRDRATRRPGAPLPDLEVASFDALAAALEL